MKVLFDHQTFSFQKFGGNSRYFHELMNVFHTDGEPSFDLGVAVSPNEYLRTAAYYRGKPSPDTSTGAFLRRYARNELHTLALSRRNRYDLVHATFYAPGVQRLVRDGKLVVTVLDMIPEHFPEYFTTTGLYGRFVTKRWIEGKRTLCERADAILAISETTKRDVVKFYGIDPSRITVTHLGNRLSGGGDAPHPAGFPARYVLFVGTRNTYKNFAFFLEAAATVLGDTGIACIGGGAFDATELALIDRLGLTNRIVQRSVADHELAACYAHAAAFVFPSRYEGFGIPILEAFACGAPTLLANASCFPEIAADAARYFDPDDRAALSAALADVLTNARIADDLRAKGRARARAFTWEATAHRTLDVYRKACA